jgi:hypothetical protein
MSGNGCSRSHGGTYQMCTATLPLPTLEISIGGRGTALTGLKPVGIHGKTHRTTRLPPFKTGLYENLIQTFLFRLLFYQT